MKWWEWLWLGTDAESFIIYKIITKVVLPVLFFLVLVFMVKCQGPNSQPAPVSSSSYTYGKDY